MHMLLHVQDNSFDQIIEIDVQSYYWMLSSCNFFYILNTATNTLLQCMQVSLTEQGIVIPQTSRAPVLPRTTEGESCLRTPSERLYQRQLTTNTSTVF